MPRRRFAVALLAPPEQAAEVDVLRRAAGVPEPFHVAPHVTLVPPVNVAETDVAVALAVVRRVAGAGRPLRLAVGPAATFRPETPTLHLDVADGDLDMLRSLRGDLRSGPFDRPDVWPFHPHVTICDHADGGLIDAGLTALAGVRQTWEVGAVHLLEQRRSDPAYGRAYWVPVHEEPLGGPTVVGRGGIELSLRTVSMVESPVAELLCREATVPATVPGPVPVVVVAEDPHDRDTVLGAIVGSVPVGGDVAELDQVVVAPDHRGIGVGGQLFRAWCSTVASHGARTAVAAPDPSDDDQGGYLAHMGFEQLRGRWFRPV